jgi:hypothetical protein
MLCWAFRAALGHLGVMQAVVEVLQSSAADIAATGASIGGQGGPDGSGEIKDASLSLFTWGRFVKDVINARTTGGKTPLMLACEQGCVFFVCSLPICCCCLIAGCTNPKQASFAAWSSLRACALPKHCMCSILDMHSARQRPCSGISARVSFHQQPSL